MNKADHHPSCRESDMVLVWFCNQCGAKESAEGQPQEWTPEYIAKMFEAGFTDSAASFESVAKMIVDAHNAALAAATKDAIGLAQWHDKERRKLAGDLAAEREQFKRRVKGFCDSMDGLKKDLAAEREKHDRLLELFKQLAQVKEGK
jgi:hypothetical protein